MTNTYTTYTTLRGNIIIANETGTHRYMWPEGRKGERVRIKKAEYEQIIREDELERKMMAEQEDAEVEAAVEATEESQTTEEAKEIADFYCRHPEGTDLQKPVVINQYGCVDCSKCNVQNCVHRDCMRRNPTSVGGLGECPRLEVKEQEIPDKKRTRKSKDIAYDGNGITLTAKQVDFIRHLPDTCFWERGLDSALWTDVLADEIGGQFAGKPMTTGAMISTICEKGLANRAADRVNGRKSTFMVLTELGKKVAAELGLN